MKFREAQAEIEQLVEKSRTGETNLAYVDEAGFAQAQPNRTAWTEKGEVHLITAERGKRLNVLAALISTLVRLLTRIVVPGRRHPGVVAALERPDRQITFLQ